MALHQCDIFRGRRPADNLARCAKLIRRCRAPVACESIGSTGRNSRRLVRGSCAKTSTAPVPWLHAASGTSSTTAADVFLRYLLQTGCRMHMTMNLSQRDMQLQGCQLGHMLPEHPKTMWPVAEDIVRSLDVSAWKSALYDGHRSAGGFHVLSVEGTMKIATGVRRHDNSRTT